jgi:hypothetical protein
MSQTEFYRGVAAAALALAPQQGPAERAAAVHAALAPLFDDTALAPTRACRRGCDHCCHLPVGVTFGEALRLAAAIERLPPVQAKVVTDARQTAATDWAALVGQPCPLLAHGACVVHADRPLACRALASSDAEACARALRGPAVVPLDGEALWRGLGAGDALAAAEPAAGHRELRSALAAVLVATDAGRADAFLGARPVGDDAVIA